jgi:hypothetical protein
MIWGPTQDEFVTSGVWQEVSESEATSRHMSAVNQSPVDPGDGYRLLRQGETLQQGDEWWRDGQWAETLIPGMAYCITTPCRRKIESPPAPQPVQVRLWRDFECRVYATVNGKPFNDVDEEITVDSQGRFWVQTKE